MAFVVSVKAGPADQGARSASNTDSVRETQRSTSSFGSYLTTESRDAAERSQTGERGGTDKSESETERSKSRSKSIGRDNEKSEISWVAASITSPTEAKAPEFTAPARSILHVQDLERIISMIRVERTSDFPTIAVKLQNSVFDGLEFKLSIDRNGLVNAEFLTLNDSVRQAIQSRSADLIAIFAERGIDLGSLDVSLGSGNKGDDQPAPGGALSLTENLQETLESDEPPADQTSISYLT